MNIFNSISHFSISVKKTSTGIDPSVYPGLILWMDGSDTTKITQTSNAVSNWRDKSTNDFSFNQATAVNKPIYSTNSLNGLSTISFSSSPSVQYLGGGTSTRNFKIGTNSFSLFVVFKFTNSITQINTFDCIFNKSIYGGQDGRIMMGRGSINATDSIMNFTIETTLLTMNPTFTNTDTNWQILELVFNRSPLSLTVYKNGTVVSQSTSATTNRTTDLTNSNNMVIGAYNINSSTPDPNYPITSPVSKFDGSIAEIIGYSTTTDMTVVTRQKLEGYLAWKWGLQTSLPTTHPYYNTKPTF